MEILPCQQLLASYNSQEASSIEGGTACLPSYSLTRQGKGVTEASRTLGITPEYDSRAFKRRLVELLTDKLMLKLH